MDSPRNPSQAKLAYNRQWKKDNLKSYWVSKTLIKAKERAERKNIPYDLSHAYVMSIMDTHCPIFGTEFVLLGSRTNKELEDAVPNIDRIDPAKGYVEGNIAVISARANRIKSAYKSADLYKVADWLYEIEKNDNRTR